MDTSCFHVPERKCARRVLTGLLLLAGLTAGANTPPTVTVSAAMRAGTTLMDVTYRVTDPDDATVKVRALAFVDGVRSFAKVIRPTAWMEGTEVNLGDAITTGVDHTLTWDVRQDWNTDLGNLKFEVLCRDNRGLLEFDWITIPAAGGKPELTISKNSPTDAQVLDALFWQYAAGDPALTLDGADLTGTPAGGVYEGVKFVKGASLQYYAIPYLLKLMNLDPAFDTEVEYASVTARAPIVDTQSWHAASRPYQGVSVIHRWGYLSNSFLDNTPCGLSRVVNIKVSLFFAAVLKADGTITWWKIKDSGGQITRAILAQQDGFDDYALGVNYIATLSKSNIIATEFVSAVANEDRLPMLQVPDATRDYVALVSSDTYCLALDVSGEIHKWGRFGASVPPEATSIAFIAPPNPLNNILALNHERFVVSWGQNNPLIPPAEYQGNVSMIMTGFYQDVFILTDGRLVTFRGSEFIGKSVPPTPKPQYLHNVVQVAVGDWHSLALTSSGEVIAWGNNYLEDGNIVYGGQAIVPSFVKKAVSIAISSTVCWAVVKEY